MGGLGGMSPGMPSGLLKNPMLSKIFDPTAQRNYQIKQGLMGAGLALMNPDPRTPPSFGASLGRMASGGIQNAQQASRDFMDSGMQNVQLMELQREYDQRDQQTAAMEKLIPTLPKDIQDFARAYPQQFGEAYMKAQMPGEGYTLSPGQTRYGGNNQPVATGGPEPQKFQEVILEDGVYAVDLKTGQKHKIGERANRNEGEGREFSQEDKLRESYLKQSKPFADLRVNYQRIQAAAQDNTGASDIAMVYSFMKMLDPTSVVREGEFATAQNAGGVPEQVIAMYNKILTGERLAPQVRADFVQQANRQFEEQIKSYEATRQMYGGLATQYGLDPSRVAPDIAYGVGVTAPNKSNISPDAIDAELRRRGVIK